MQLSLNETGRTLNTDWDNLMLWSFSNSTGSSEEYLILDCFSDLGISFVLMWPLRSRILMIFMLLGDLKPCTRVIDSIANARKLKK